MELSKSIIHVHQTGNWDCGIACVQMILGERVKLPPQAPRSTWTIDLAHLLHGYDVKFHYTTITFGANVDYSDMAFYATLKQDAARVDALFDKAAQTGIAIEKKSATKDELIAHVKGGGAIIVLVDTNYLVCNKCAPRWWKRSADRVLPPSSYHGHYIILIAYNESKEEFAFRDPDRADDTCFVFASQLDTARKRTGTDEDILWIHAAMPSTVPPQPSS